MLGMPDWNWFSFAVGWFSLSQVEDALSKITHSQHRNMNRYTNILNILGMNYFSCRITHRTSRWSWGRWCLAVTSASVEHGLQGLGFIVAIGIGIFRPRRDGFFELNEQKYMYFNWNPKNDIYLMAIRVPDRLPVRPGVRLAPGKNTNHRMKVLLSFYPNKKNRRKQIRWKYN